MGNLKQSLCISSGVNFTNLCAPGKKLPHTSIVKKFAVQFHQQNAEICQTLFAVCQICVPKKSFSSFAHKKKPGEYVGEIDPWREEL